MTDAPSMLAYALAYARRGYHVFPAHEPIFDAAGNVTGCTCEEYRRSEECRQNHSYLYLGPDGHCKQPGKCPRVRWKEKSTTDERTLRRWWGRWPAANIGIDAGKSGLLAIDADTYKDEFDGGVDLDEETVTSLTGGGGVHLWYKMPDGATWGNAKGDLPPGIDVRGAGGYVVAPPSLHASGRRYAFEHGYGPGEIELAAVPAALAAILDDAQTQAPAGKVAFSTAARWDGVPTTAAPDLERFKVSDAMRALIANPPPKGKRSEADHSVTLALIYAGATDDDILAVFEHCPIGTAGKFAEDGRRYLERTVAKARAFAGAHPRPNWLAVRAALHGGLLDDLTTPGKRGSMLAVMLVAVDLLRQHGRAGLPVRDLVKLASVSVGTASARLQDAVDLELLSAETDAKGRRVYRLGPVLEKVSKLEHAVSVKECETACSNSDTFLAALERGPSELERTVKEDAFCRSLSHIEPDAAAKRRASAKPRKLTGRKPYEESAEFERRCAATMDSLGRGCWRLRGELYRAGGTLTKKELTVRIGPSARHYWKKLAEAGLVEMDHHTVWLVEDEREKLERITPHMPTYGTLARRTAQVHEERSAQAIYRELHAPDEEAAALALRSFNYNAAKLAAATREHMFAERAKALATRRMAAGALVDLETGEIFTTPIYSHTGGAAALQLSNRPALKDAALDRFVGHYGRTYDEAEIMLDMADYRAQAYAAQGAD